jgi:hypothetical protein
MSAANMTPWEGGKIFFFGDQEIKAFVDRILARLDDERG